jgi:protein-disulfide isomerase
MDKNLLIAVGVIVGIVVGFTAGYLISQPQDIEGCFQESQTGSKLKSQIKVNYDVVDYAVDYINDYMIRPGLTTKVVDAKASNYYKVKIEIYSGDTRVGNASILVSEDGKELVLDLINISEPPRVEVSADDDPYKGSENARVVLVEFSDFACPYCAKLEKEVIPKILERYGDKIKLVYRDYPVHDNISIVTASASNCAGEQGKYWEYHDLLFERQSEWIKGDVNKNSSFLYDYAEEIGLNVEEFRACLLSEKYAEEVKKDYLDGIKAGVTGTPTIFVNGIKIEGYNPPEVYFSRIDKELEKTQ